MPGAPSDGATGGAGATGDQQAFSGSGLGLGTPGGGLGGGGTSVARGDGGGYIDSAIPVNQLRVRFDSMIDANRPDRAEFFYPECGCFRFQAFQTNGRQGDAKASGPGTVPSFHVDAQEYSLYGEVAPSERFSVFAEVPIRSVNFNNALIADNTGLSDVNFGFKYAFVADECQFLTFQLRVFSPTGDGGEGLGTNHWTAEPALLYYRKLSDRLFVQGEFRYWAPLEHPDQFTGNVLRYGAGVTYLAYCGPSFRVSPVLELVGWTVVDGKETVPGTVDPIQDASGDTILNAKAGVRIGFGDQSEPGMLSQSDVYIGYGRALTGDVWYKDIIRAELRLRF
jgi:hypothetical protein